MAATRDPSRTNGRHMNPCSGFISASIAAAWARTSAALAKSGPGGAGEAAGADADCAATRAGVATPARSNSAAAIEAFPNVVRILDLS
jgi:hypothetical protein